MNIRTKVPTSTEQVSEQIAKVAPLQPLVVHQSEVKAYPPKIAKAILKITRELAPVKKAGVNDFHKYQYPKWEDVLDELGPKITENGLIVTMGEISHGGFQEGRMMEATYEFTIINDDGDVWPDRPRITQMCKLVDNKGQIDDKAASKAHTQAQKYFLMQLFKIRVRDMEVDDLDYDPQKHKAVKRRPVPTSTGKIAPHRMDTKENETAKSWVERFFANYAKAANVAECNAWAEENTDILDRLAEKAPDTYNTLVNIMNEKVAALAPKVAPAVVEKKFDPITTGTAPGFPGDTPIKATEEGGIPTFLRRTAALTKDEQEWLHGLGGAFSGCEDLSDLADQQQRLMTSQQANVSEAAWKKATDLLQEHIDRLGGE